MDQRPFRDRAQIVCVACHARKVKCDLQDSLGAICRNCRRTSQPCIRRDGVRNKRKARNPRGFSSSQLSSPPGGRGSATEEPPDVTAAQRVDRDRASRRPGGFLASSSIMGYGEIKEPDSRANSRPLALPSVSAKEAILQLTEAAVLPPLNLQQALKDAFIEHAFQYYSILEPGELSGPNCSVLLQQTVCLAGSLLQHRPSSLVLGHSQYEKVKTLLFVNYEEDELVVLKNLCILACWSPTSPSVVTLDGSWHWTGTAVRLAIQMGLHKQVTYSRYDNPATLRRMFWLLRHAEQLMLACWGRPPALRPADSDVPPLTEQDFPAGSNEAQTSIQFSRIITIIGRIGELTISKHAPSMEDIVNLVSAVCNWQRELPDELRLHDANGLRRRFHLPAVELHIHYFTAIVLLQMSSMGPDAPLRTSAPSVLAASYTARLYDEIDCREHTAHLLPFHSFFCLVAAVPLILCGSNPETKMARDRDLAVVRSILGSMRAKYGNASLALKKIQFLLHEIEGGREGRGDARLGTTEWMDSASAATRTMQGRMADLFPFPVSLQKSMDVLNPGHELGESPPQSPAGENLVRADADGMAEPVQWQAQSSFFTIMDMFDVDFDTFQETGGIDQDMAFGTL